VTTKYSVRRVPAVDAEAEVLELSRRRSGKANRSVFHWGYLANPVGPADCFLLDASSDGSSTVVGMVGVGPRRFEVGGKNVSAGLLGGFFVDKGHRTFFPALMLQRAVLGWARQNFDLVYGFPNTAAAPIMTKLGFRNLARLERYVLVLRHAPYIASRVGSRALGRALALPFDGVRRLVHPGISRGASRGLAFGRVRTLDQRFDRLFRARAFSDVSMGQRDAKLLQWRFLERPDEDTSIYALSSREDGELRAYVVVRVHQQLANVRDLLGVDLDSMAEALRLAAGAARRAGCTSLSFLCAAPPRLHERLSALGFRVRPEPRHLIGHAGGALTTHDPASLERWYLTEADEDQ